MAARGLEKEVKEALSCIEKNENFILSGGAGSGKTHSLVSLIEEVGNKYPLNSIVCITYTNNAVAEIRNRITNRNLIVSTIHEFIWSIISKYQFEIKTILVELINNEENKKFNSPKDFHENQKIEVEYFENSIIKYDEYYNLRKEKSSKISHDHILIVAERMFEKYSKLCDILKDMANFIFVDEYQDTDPLIKEILLKHLAKSSKHSIIGFFGDSMQSIYDTGIGSINDDNLKRINKMQNRRNPKVVIDLANKLRDDGIEQVPSQDLNAPNMENGEVIEGNIQFIYADSIDELDNFRKKDVFKDWNFNDSKSTKELWLVHRANANMAGFPRLFELYNSDKIIELISKTGKEVNKKKIDTTNRSLESIAEEADCCVRGRGNLLKNIKDNPDYISSFEWIKNENWQDVCIFRINKDSLLSYKLNGLTRKYEAKTQRDLILRRLDSIYELIELYKGKNYNEFLKKLNWNISSIDDKRFLNEKMSTLCYQNLSIGQIIDAAQEIMKTQDASFDEFIIGQGRYLWVRIKELPFNEYIKSIEYQKEHLPFATQHSVKGSEFDNVLVILDNGNWNSYNFERMFTDYNSSNKTIERTKKLFYVCCTRAKKNLTVFMPTSDPIVIKNAKDFFGEDNMYPPI